MTNTRTRSSSISAALGQLRFRFAALKRRVTNLLFHPGFGWLFRLLRRYRPVWSFGGRHGGLALVLRYDDVTDVYSRDDIFSVRLYGNRMAETTGAFILGMDDGPVYQREAGIAHQLVRREDAARIRRVAEAEAERIVAGVLAERGTVDVVADLAMLVHPAFVADYYGFDAVDPRTVIRWFRTTAFYVFNFWPGSWLQVHALEVAHEITDHLRGRLAARRAAASASSAAAPRDDLLGRLLELQAHSTDPPITDDDLVRSMAGIVSGSVEPGVSSFAYLIDALLDRPEELRAAQNAARAGDDDRVRRYLLEAARFGCYPPALSRYCYQDHTFGIGTRWERRIPAGTTVVPMQASAMFDAAAVPNPYRFDVTRPPDFYRNFGAGIHRCLGEAIGKELWMAMALPLLRRHNLRRAPGPNAFPRTARWLDIPDGLYVQHLEVAVD